jgi:hypothetical protein
MKTKEKIKPVGSFPDTPEGFKQYENQWPEEKMEIRNYLMCHIDKPNPDFVDVHKNSESCYVVSIKGEITLFFNNYDELCIFGKAITDGISKLRDIDKEIEARQEYETQKAEIEEDDGEY